MGRLRLFCAFLVFVASLTGVATAAEPEVRVIAVPADRAAVTAVAARVAVRTGGPGVVARRYVTGTPGEAFVLDARRSNGTLVAIDVHAVLAGRVRYLGTSVADARSRSVSVVAPDGSRSGPTTVEDGACSTNCNLASALAGFAAGLGCGVAVTAGGLAGGAVGAYVGTAGCGVISSAAGYLVADNCETAEMCTPLIRWTQFTCGYPGCGGLGFIVSPYPLTPDQYSAVEFAGSGHYIYTAAASFYFREANGIGYTYVSPQPAANTASPYTYTFSHDLPRHPYNCPDDSFAVARVVLGGGKSDPMSTPVVGGCNGLGAA